MSGHPVVFGFAILTVVAWMVTGPFFSYSDTWQSLPHSPFKLTAAGWVSSRGIAKAKAAGVYKGRPASIDAAQVRAMKAQGARSIGDCESAQDRRGVGLSGVGRR
jgi:Low affinity iron permease